VKERMSDIQLSGNCGRLISLEFSMVEFISSSTFHAETTKCK
jgi:hypothetical protein